MLSFASALLAYAGMAEASVASAAAKSVTALESKSVSTAATISASSFELLSAQYFRANTNFYRSGAKAENNSFTLNLQERRTWGKRRSAEISMRNEYSSSEEANYLNVHQVYAAYRLDSGVQLSFGRKMEDWSTWENTWSQGLFQSRYIQNRLHPEMAGLSGLFINLPRGRHDFLLALLPMSVPEFGPRFFVRDGKFVSPNPWFNPPASMFEYRQQFGAIRYSLNRPTTLEAISYPGFAARYQFRPQENHHLRISYAFKPLPLFLLGFPSRERVQVRVEGEEMGVEINTRMLYHQVLSTDYTFRAANWDIGISAVYERPSLDTGPADWTSQQIGPALIGSITASRSLEDSGAQAARLRLSAMKMIGGDRPDQGDFANPTSSLFERRYQYTEAYMLGLQKPLRGWMREPIINEVSLLYDRMQNGGFARLSSTIAFERNWRAELRLDVLGLMGESGVIKDGFLGNYRANDRVAMGMSYVF
jgi:hypothetical protein